MATNMKDFSDYIKDPKIVDILETSLKEYVTSYITNNKYSSDFFEPCYREKKNELLYNLDPIHKNEILLNIINSKNITEIKKIPQMIPSEINPEIWKKELAKKHLKEYKEQNMATSTEYTCRKCGAKKVRVSSQQTRSADEGMTIFVVCLNCGNTWKF